MTTASGPRWKRMCTDETREVEKVLRAEFAQADAYRYNSASIRVRVIDSRFEGRSVEERDAMVELHLRRLPERTQADIINLFTFAPSELEGTEKTLRAALLNLEFEDPSPSEL